MKFIKPVDNTILERTKTAAIGKDNAFICVAIGV